MTRRLTGRIVPPSGDLIPLTEMVLELLARSKVRATFFIVGDVAEAIPSLVRIIADGGHEIATHGYSHVRVDSLRPEEFREEVRRSVAVLQELSGQRVLGHRAAEFSITKQSLWALEILAEEGLVYDSSIFPIRSVRSPPCGPSSCRPVGTSLSKCRMWRNMRRSSLPICMPSRRLR